MSVQSVLPLAFFTKSTRLHRYSGTKAQPSRPVVSECTARGGHGSRLGRSPGASGGSPRPPPAGRLPPLSAALRGTETPGQGLPAARARLSTPGPARPCPARGPPTSGQQVDEHEQRQVEEDEEPQVQPVRLPRQRRRRHRRRVPLRRRLLPAPRPRRRRRHLLTQLRHGTARGRRSLRRRLQPFRARSQWEASARSRAATPQGGAAASRDGRWRPLAAVGRGLPLWQPPSALCSSVRAASGSLRRDLGGNKRSPLAVSAPWRAGGLLEQTERPPWEDTQGKPACPRKLVAARTPSGSVEEFMHAVGFKARNCIKNSKKRSCTACTAF